mmetsp:Transcript_79305/g.220533  ORF Transcript_79305/g.220533 Transcript_79305/m.220533 type:complete len:350 (-) Transcript_79305:654-1703(-)
MQWCRLVLGFRILVRPNEVAVGHVFSVGHPGKNVVQCAQWTRDAGQPGRRVLVRRFLHQSGSSGRQIPRHEGCQENAAEREFDDSKWYKQQQPRAEPAREAHEGQRDEGYRRVLEIEQVLGALENACDLAEHLLELPQACHQRLEFVNALRHSIFANRLLPKDHAVQTIAAVTAAQQAVRGNESEASPWQLIRRRVEAGPVVQEKQSETPRPPKHVRNADGALDTLHVQTHDLGLELGRRRRAGARWRRLDPDVQRVIGLVPTALDIVSLAGGRVSRNKAHALGAPCGQPELELYLEHAEGVGGHDHAAPWHVPRSLLVARLQTLRVLPGGRHHVEPGAMSGQRSGKQR